MDDRLIALPLILGMYRTLQFFVLALKIDIFIEFLVSVFYLIQFALKRGGLHQWTTFVLVIITILILPFLYFGRSAAASESTTKMVIFIVFQLCVVFQLVLIAIDATKPGDYWYTWICFGKIKLTCNQITFIVLIFSL